jgi:D-alanyl-D-alanine carboxypeptidase
MLRSGNDASYAIANYVDKEHFVDMMNQKAHEIGMLNTLFTNPNGLDEESGNYSTSYDMAILASYAMKNEEYRKIVGTRKYIVKTNKKTYEWINKNKLLFSVDYITGGKTGFTTKARRTLVTTARKNDINLVAVTLDDKNDFKDHVNMFEYGYKNYIKKDILKAGKLNLFDDKYYGKYFLTLKKSFSYLLNMNDDLVLKYELAEKPSLGNTGKVRVILNNRQIYSDNIYASEKESKRSFFERFKIW